MRIVLTALLSLILLQTMPGVARAQDTAPQNVDPAKAALVERYFEAISMEKLMNGILESMLASLAEDSDLPPQQSKIIQTAALEAFESVHDDMFGTYIALYADAFTLEELESLVAFYESPTGRSLMAKTLVLTQQSGEIYQQFQPRIEAEMMRRVCSQIDCQGASAKR